MRTQVEKWNFIRSLSHYPDFDTEKKVSTFETTISVVVFDEMLEKLQKGTSLFFTCDRHKVFDVQCLSQQTHEPLFLIRDNCSFFFFWGNCKTV